MSQRGMSASVLAEIVKSAVQFCHLVEVRFDAGDGGTVYLTDSYKPISYGGNTYQALGHFLDFDGLEEAVELKTSQATVTLSGVDQTWISDMLTLQYMGRTLLIYGAFLDSSDALISSPFVMLEGPMDAPAIAEDPTSGKCTVSVAVTSLGADFDSPAGRHTSVAEQQLFFPSDTCFKYTPQVAGQLAGRQVLWGRPGPQPA